MSEAAVRRNLVVMEPTAPEARQNLTPDTDQFGSVAVRAGDNRWLIGNPANGAHWGTDADVDGWAPGTFQPVAPAPAE